MKKLTLLIVLTILFFSQQIKAQAFDDVVTISKMINEGRSNMEIAEIILPYFTKNGILKRKEMENALKGELWDITKAYLDERAKNLGLIRKYGEQIPDGNKVKSILAEADKLIGQMNDGLEDKKYEILKAPKKFNLDDIVSFEIKYETESQLVLLRDAKSGQGGEAGRIVDSLQKIMDTTTFQCVDDILKKLNLLKLNSKKVLEKKAEIAAEIKNNTKFDSFLEKERRPKEQRELVVGVLRNYKSEELKPLYSSEIAPLSTSFNLPNQSEALDALVILVAKRFNQEVTITFMEALRKRARDMKLITDVFPNTYKLLHEGHAYEIPKLGAVWHQSIAQDIYNLPMNLRSSEYLEKKMQGNKTQNYLLFQDIVTIGELARSGYSLPEITLLYKSGLSGGLNNGMLKTGFELINLINQEFRASGNEQGNKFWLDWSKLNSLDNRQWNFLFQLISERYKEVLFDQLKLDAANLLDVRWQQFRSTMLKALVLLNQFQDNKIAALKLGTTGKIRLMSFWECQQQLFGILLNEQLLQGSAQTRTIVNFANRALQIYRMQEEGNYPTMLRESILMARELLPAQTSRLEELMLKNWKLSKDKYMGLSDEMLSKFVSLNLLYDKVRSLDATAPGKEERFKELLSTFSKEQNIKIDSTKDHVAILRHISAYYQTSLSGVKQGMGKKVMYVESSSGIYNIIANAWRSSNRNFARPLESGRSMTMVLKTAEFFTDVMAAGNSKQLAQVIESYAMPPNSYKVKRNTRYSIDLDAYVGLYTGVESLGSKTPDSIAKFAPVWGLSAPIGISFSWGSRRNSRPGETTSFLDKSGHPKTLSGNSFSITVSMLDIAAPLAFRLSNDSEEALPKSLSWAQLFSPGLHFRWGIRNTPLCFSTGLQYTPQLRKMNLSTTNQQAYRAYVGLFFDIPLFNIYKRN